MSYVSANLNRHYAAVEPSYGQVPAVASSDAFRVVSFDAELVQEYLERRDKSGSRSFLGVPQAGRREARFALESYLMSGGTAGAAPDLAPLYQAACGGAPLAFGGGSTAAGCTTTTIVFSTVHGLAAGQAIVVAGEMRFVTSVPNSTTVVVAPALSSAPAGGTPVSATVTYPLAATLPSVSLFDYWDPANAQQRILSGGAVERMGIEVQGDFHSVSFSGGGQDLIDSITFAAGQGGLAAFPAEPVSRSYAGAPIAGHFGQIWLDDSRITSLVSAGLVLANNLQMRNNELGSAVPLGIAPGDRNVQFEFELYQTDDAAVQALYTAARNRSPLSMLLQLGSTAGHIFAAYISSLVPQTPRTSQRQNELQWSFAASRAGGANDDEIWIAFG